MNYELMNAVFFLDSLISFGRLESIFTGFFQVAMPIGLILFILGIFVLLIPQSRRFVGGLLGF